MSEARIRKNIIPISFYAFLLGMLYLISCALCMFNWLSSYILHKEGLLASFAPSDLWLAVVFFAIGSILVSSLYYLVKGNLFLSISSLLIGTSASSLVMGIQVLALIAVVLDRLVNQEPISTDVIITGLVRADVILGIIAVPALFFSYKLYLTIRK